MENKKSIFILIVLVTLAIALYDPYSDVTSHLSPNMKAWLDKGKYFTYKNAHKIFYVHQELDSFEFDVDEKKGPITILFLHGFPTSSYDFIKIWNQFTAKDEFKHLHGLNDRRISLLAVDHLGYGFSDKPSKYEYSIFDSADMIDHLLTSLNIKSIIIVAHDMSDTVAQEMLLRDTLKDKKNHYEIEKCVLMNGGIIYELIRPILSQRILLNEFIGDFLSRYFSRFFYFKYSFSRIFGALQPPTESDLLDFFLGIHYNKGNEVLTSTIKYMRNRQEHGDVWYRALNDTKRPVMFIYGPADPIMPHEQFTKRMLNDLPNVKLIVLSDLVGHYPQFEDPFTVYTLIKNFLGQQ